MFERMFLATFLLAAASNNPEVFNQEIELLKSFVKPDYSNFAVELVTNLFNHRVVEITMQKTPGFYGMIFPKEGEWLENLAKTVRNSDKPFKVLGLGSACGYIELYLTACGAKSRVVDISPREIEIGKSLAARYGFTNKDIDFFQKDIFNLKDFGGYFDAIICRNLLHFVNKDKEDLLIMKIKQSLAKNGQAVIVCDYSKKFVKIQMNTEYNTRILLLSCGSNSKTLYMEGGELCGTITDPLEFLRTDLCVFTICFEDKAKIVNKKLLKGIPDKFQPYMLDNRVLEFAEQNKNYSSCGSLEIKARELINYKRYLSTEYLEKKFTDNGFLIGKVENIIYGMFEKTLVIAKK